MKPRNFPGRKYSRKVRARVIQDDAFAGAYVKDIKLRVGAKMRDARGLPR